MDTTQTPVTDNLNLADGYEQTAATVDTSAQGLRAVIDQEDKDLADAERLLAERRAKQATRREQFAELARQHNRATTLAAHHREAAEFLAAKYGYALPASSPAAAPAAQAGPVMCGHCDRPIHRLNMVDGTKWQHTDSGQYACRPETTSPWAEPWSEVPAQGEQSAEVAAL